MPHQIENRKKESLFPRLSINLQWLDIKYLSIDEVHMLTKEAFNALLKTLEEPPDFVKFILATTDP